MAILNSGFLVDNPMDLTEPLEKLIKVGFGLDRDAPVEEIEVALDDDEDDEEDRQPNVCAILRHLSLIAWFICELIHFIMSWAFLKGLLSCYTNLTQRWVFGILV
jgi:hypothetical protein